MGFHLSSQKGANRQWERAARSRLCRALLPPHLQKGLTKLPSWAIVSELRMVLPLPGTGLARPWAGLTQEGVAWPSVSPLLKGTFSRRIWDCGLGRSDWECRGVFLSSAATRREKVLPPVLGFSLGTSATILFVKMLTYHALTGQ